MASPSQSADPGKTADDAPSGFIEYAGQMLVVDYGHIYDDGVPVGFLYEDGFLKDTCGLLGIHEGLRPIDELHECIFHGISSSGAQLTLPDGFSGPSGTLKFNGRTLNVINGRLSTPDHKLVGQFDDQGALTLRDEADNGENRLLDENSLLATQFEGVKSSGAQWKWEYLRPLTKKDRTYSDNEVIRYFEEFDSLNAQQKKYVIDSMKLWARSGLLQIVRKSEGTAALGNVKHGAAGQTGVRSGYVTLDREEFNTEILLHKRFGALAVLSTKWKPFVEVRSTLVVAHEFGHQLEFILSQAAQDRVRHLFEERCKKSYKMNPLPSGYDGVSEILEPQNVVRRVFITGYSRTSWNEYWAEAVAAFSLPDSRAKLREVDQTIHDMLHQLVINPSTLVRQVLHNTIRDLRCSLRLGQEYDDKILDE